MPTRGHSLITSFAYGEISPRWQARITSDPFAEIYQHGCRECTNMIVLPQGGGYKRLGTQWVGGDVVGVDNSRFMRYRSLGFDYLVVFTDLKVQFFDTRTRPFTEVGTGLTTPYTSADIGDVWFAQTGSRLFLVHPAYRFRYIELNESTGLFEFFDADEILTRPVYTFNDDKSPDGTLTTITVTFAGAWKAGDTFFCRVSATNAIDILSSGGVEPISFINERAYAYSTNTAIQANRIASALRQTPAVRTASPVVIDLGGDVYEVSYEFIPIQGNGTGTLDMVTDIGSGTIDEVVVTEGVSLGEPLWSSPTVVTNGASPNFYQCDVSHVSGAVNEPGVGANWPDFWTDLGTTEPTFDFDKLGPWVTGFAYTPRDRGWPRSVTFHEERMICDGGPSAPAVFVGTAIRVLKDLDFDWGGLVQSDPFLFEISGHDGVSIQWFLSQRELFIGTTNGLYVQSAKPLTPTSIELSRHSMHRARTNRVLQVSGELFHVHDNGRQVRQVQFVRDYNSWEARDLTRFADHMWAEDKQLKVWDFMDEPDSLIWAVREDGGLLAFTYDDQYEVNAWHKHNLGEPTVDCVTCFDEFKEILVVAVKRQVFDGVSAFDTVISIEVLETSSVNLINFDPTDWDPAEPTENTVADYIVTDADGSTWTPHVDSYTRFTGDGTNTINEPRFANRTVAVVENGVDLGTFTADAGGTITLLDDTIVGSTIFAGYRFTSRLTPTRYDDVLNAGTTQSMKIRWTKPELRLVSSTMPLVNGERLRDRSVDDFYDTSPGLFTGDAYIVHYGSDNDLVIEADQPLPFQMTGIFGLMTTEEG